MSVMRCPLMIATLVALACLAGCASGPGAQGTSTVRVVHDKSALGADVQLVDVHVFKVQKRKRGDMNAIARDYARELGADAVLVRVTDDTGPDVIFSVEAYRRVRD